jgi:hypothetical protein
MPKANTPVEPHPYSVKLTRCSKKGRWPSFKGEIYEHDVLIGSCWRGATVDHFVPPIEYKFRTDASFNRFDNFADCLSVEESIEAILPKEAFGA